MCERKGVERALSNIFERTHGRQPTDDELKDYLDSHPGYVWQEGLAQEGLAKGPPEVRVTLMDILECPLVLVPGVQRYPMRHKWPRPLAFKVLQDGTPTLWVALTEDEVDVDLCVHILPTGSGLDMTTWHLDHYVGTWINASGTVRHVFAWGEVHQHEPA